LPEFVDTIKNMDPSLMRIVPTWQAVKDNPELLPEEDIREIYRRADTIVLVPCCCRVEMYDRECSCPDEVCIALNRSAEYNLRRGVGKKLTAEEAIALEDTVRKRDPIITIMPNTAVVDQLICHCHTCCCLTFIGFKQFATVQEGFAKSRYEAVVDPEKCTGCQKCIEVCQFDVLEMKQYASMTKWKPEVDPEKCMGCGSCVVACPKKGAVTLKVVRPPEHIPQKEFDVYKSSREAKK